MVSQQAQSTFDAYWQRKSRRASGTRSLEEVRERYAPGGRVFPVPDDVDVAAIDACGVPVTWFAPPGGGDVVLLYLHGGGFSVGSARAYGELTARLARAAGARTVVPEYRLVPEHRYPAAVDDIAAVWSWLRESGLNAGRIVVAGDSAGGALAMALVVGLRDAGQDLPAGLALFSPVVDMTASGESVVGREDRDPLFTANAVRATGPAYAPNADLSDPRISPLFADLRGLPPLLVQVGTEETLFSDSERLVEAAQAAGVDATLDVAPGMFHVYQAVGDAPEAIDATDRAGAFLRDATLTRGGQRRAGS
jgi:epsilon-lactone hydrolase